MWKLKQVPLAGRRAARDPGVAADAGPRLCRIDVCSRRFAARTGSRRCRFLLQSLDLDEILVLADRVAVMLRGRVVAVLDRTEADEERVGAFMTGATA